MKHDAWREDVEASLRSVLILVRPPVSLFQLPPLTDGTSEKLTRKTSPDSSRACQHEMYNLITCIKPHELRATSLYPSYSSSRSLFRRARRRSPWAGSIALKSPASSLSTVPAFAADRSEAEVPAPTVMPEGGFVSRSILSSSPCTSVGRRRRREKTCAEASTAVASASWPTMPRAVLSISVVGFESRLNVVEEER